MQDLTNLIDVMLLDTGVSLDLPPSLVGLLSGGTACLDGVFTWVLLSLIQVSILRQMVLTEGSV